MRSAWRTILCCGIILGAASGGGRYVYCTWLRPAAEARQVYANGSQAARRDWAAGNARVCHVVPGKTLPRLASLDPETGLNIFEVGGCLCGDSDFEYAKGYNDTIRSRIGTSGVPANSRLRWKAEILQPQRYLQDPSVDPLTRACSPEETATSPDGRYSVRMETGPGAERSCEQAELLLAITMTTAGSTYSRYLPGNGDIMRFPVWLKWGPTGSDTVFLKLVCRKEGMAGKYIVLDLRDGTVLHCLYQPE